MTTLSVAEIISTACTFKTREEKIEYLRKHNSKELRNIFLLTYDESFILDLPNVAPPYTPSQINESHGLLYREARKLAYFIKNRQEGAGLTRVKKEQLFIQMLETVDKDDALVLIRMIERKPYSELPTELLEEAFGFSIAEPVAGSRQRGRKPKSDNKE